MHESNSSPVRNVVVSVVLLCIAWIPAKSPAQVSVYPPSPQWRSAPTQVTNSVAVADVDGDGFLDLITANFAQPLKLYNQVHNGGTAPAWSSVSTAFTFGVAVGDLNGDYYPDIVCGNDGTNHAYYNCGYGCSADVIFGGSPNWLSGLQRATLSVALGDVNDDGGLDLVCGNFRQPNTLYLNDGSGLDTAAAWSSDSLLGTNDVALGDIDDNGTLDLVCGNDGVNTLYLNVGGPEVFERLPAWMSDSTHVTTCVALADLDGDGDLDLVCGNADRANTVYINDGTLRTDPVYWDVDASATRSLSLGDVDLDGDTDVVVGNRDQANALFLNDGGPGVFEPVAAWDGLVEQTASVALADFDGDGGLDLATGNYNESNTVFFNLTGPFGTEPSWRSVPTASTLSVSVGDVDGANGPDVVFGNVGVNALYLNDGAMFASDPGPWFPTPDGRTSGIELADLDGDGDLDVACGNWEPVGAANTAYFNNAGDIADVPSWSSPLNVTRDVAAGDVDGDDRVDLLFGNENRTNTLYANFGSAPWFGSTPSWASAESLATTDIAVADMDGDGDLDLVCANLKQENTLFLNTSGALEVVPSWRSGTTDDTEAVDVGDVDGDGDYDIVFGNDGQPNALLVNVGPPQWFQPTWSSQVSDRTRSVALGDIDGDGDLDLVGGNASQPNAVYKNSGGDFPTSPDWSSGPANDSEDVVLYDIDDDGDLDLVCANDGQENAAYLGLRNPPFSGDIADPTNQSPNNTPVIRSVTMVKSATNTITVRFEIADVEADLAWLIAEYHFKGEHAWHAPDGVGAGGLAGPFTTSASGSVDSVDWDVSRLPFDTRPVEVRLKLIEIPQRVGGVQRLSSFNKNAGVIEPQRPRISLAQSELRFPTMTVGDTVSLDLVVANAGNVDLVIDTINLPSQEMAASPGANITVAAGNSDTVSVKLQPLYETDIAGTIELVSNDPLQPVASVNIVTDIRELAVNTRLLAPADTIPLGEAATVIVEPLPDVNVEGGHLFHRPVGAAQFDSLLLEPQDDDFVAVIPGNAVREQGLEYYVRVVNKLAVSTDPADAPDSWYTRAVSSPQSILVAPRPTFDNEYLANRAITVEVHLPRGADFVTGVIHFREGGTRIYQHSALDWDGSVASAEIPDSVVGARGIEYRVEVTMATEVISFPTAPPDTTPATISVLIPDLVEPMSHPGERYRLFSVPLDMRGSILGSLTDDLGGIDVTQWRLFGYDASASAYVELPNDSITSFDRGSAYWLITRHAHRIGTGPDRGVTTSTDRLFEVVLEPGHNLVSVPYTFPVSWESMWVDTLSAPDAVGTLVETPIGWDADLGRYDEPIAQTFEPWNGYWIKNLDTVSVVLGIPPIERVESRVAQAGEQIVPSWSVQISASSMDVEGAPAILGVREGASTAWDRFDRSMPPVAPGRSIAVYFPHAGWRLHPDAYLRDVRGDYEELGAPSPFPQNAWGHLWLFDVAKTFTASPAGDDVVIEFDSIDTVPREASVYLVDRSLGNVVDLRERSDYRFVRGSADVVAEADDARFQLIVGSEEFVRDQNLPTLPERTALHQNYPNPFNPSTIIRYDMAKSGHIRVRIYDIRGALVRVIEDRYRGPGRYEVRWNGTNEDGGRVASGVYFCRMETPETTEIRKMVLLK